MFRDRAEAGEELAKKLVSFQGKDTVVFALPRGGVETAEPIAKKLRAPLRLIIPRKIGHPSSSEYAIAAVTESGKMAGNPFELAQVDKEWLEGQKEEQRGEARRRRELYLKGVPSVPVKGKTAVIVDDGVATGLTMQVAIAELKDGGPEKIIVAVPVISSEAAKMIASEADSLIALRIDPLLSAVGSYYKDFLQVSDEKVIEILHKMHQNEKEYSR